MPKTGKERSSRIQMDYYRQGSGLSSWKVRLSIFGFVVGLGIMVYALSDRNSTNPGAVIEGHASFEQNCEACHQSITPMANDSLQTLSLVGISAEKSVDHTFRACTSCHNGASHPISGHHRSSMTEQGQLTDKNCVTCHADHQGRGHDLTRVNSDKCTNCHANLSKVCKRTKTVLDRSIESFSTHPEFSSLQHGDPGRVTFDHAQHLLPGQHVAGKDVMRLRDLEPEFRERYRKRMERLKRREPAFAGMETGDNALVQLDCQSCHVLEGQSDSPLTEAISGGADFAPIDFDLHCAACHSINPAGRTENTLPIPHAATWTEIDLWLKVKSKQPEIGYSPKPNVIGSPSEPVGDLTAVEQDARIRRARAAVRQQCLKCHDMQLLESDATIMEASAKDAVPLIPTRWLVHGRYDHGSHATVNCRLCHPQIYAAPRKEESVHDNQTVMIKGIETCNGCHRPVGAHAPAKLLVDGKADPILGQQSLWASDRCTTCHSYHGGAGKDSRDLGTVSDDLRKNMDRHGVSHVLGGALK